MINIEVLKEEHKLTSDEKLNAWGYGEWVEELDLLEFKYKEYISIIERKFHMNPIASRGGYLCGYIIIPCTHKLYGKTSNLFEDLIDCHGGITFNECKEDVHTIGFDCVHLHDYHPAYERYKKNNCEMMKFQKEIEEIFGGELMDSPFFNPTYKNISFCIEECKSIIEQLIEIDNEKV